MFKRKQTIEDLLYERRKLTAKVFNMIFDKALRLRHELIRQGFNPVSIRMSEELMEVVRLYFEDMLKTNLKNEPLMLLGMVVKKNNDLARKYKDKNVFTLSVSE